MRYRVTHETVYDYRQPVSLSHSIACLKPRATPGQTPRSSKVEVTPPAAVRSDREDWFGNRQTYFAVQSRHSRLRVHAVSEVEVNAPPEPDFEAGPPWEQARVPLGTADSGPDLHLWQLAVGSPLVDPDPRARDYALPSFSPERPLLAAVADLNSRIHRDFAYQPGFTSVATPLAEVFSHQRGVCQDFAHVALACLRALGLPGRYVSGYLETEPPPGEPRQVGADASHAWFAVHVPGHGWVDFDPTNDASPREHHITTAWGRDYGDVPPVKGVTYGGGAHDLTVAVDVTRLP